MSIRVKLTLILVFGISLGLGVSMLAYYNAYRLDRSFEHILTQDLAAVRAVAEAQKALHRARQFENLMFERAEPGLAVRIEEQIDDIVIWLETAHVRGSTSTPLYSQVRAFTDVYRLRVQQLGEHMQKAEHKHERKLAAVEGRVVQFSFKIGELRDPLERMAEADTGLVLSYYYVQDALSRVVEVLNRRDDAERIQLVDWIAELSLRTSELNQRLESTPYYYVGQELILLVEALATDGADARFELRRDAERVVELLQSNRQLESSLDQNFEILASLAWTTLDERRSESRQQQQLAFTTLLIVIVAGLALLVVLAAILLRSLGGSIGKLLEAAENIQQGDFEARVRIRTRDELQDLGMAFNAMAQFLGDRRRQQLDYNEIVSLLNSTLNADDIMTGSLREIVQRSGSSIGAFFTVEEGDSVLHLNKAFGLGEGSLARTSYNTGVGLVGQAAKTRRKILVSPVPPGFFSIDTGLGIIQPEAVLILPVVHVDRLLGVFVLVNAREYEEETLTFIEEVVFQFGVAYNNARFVDKLESTAATLRERTEELMRQSARLEQVNRELETANRLKSDFLANVTHELRTPLNSIIGFTELVLEKLVPTDEKMTRHLETVLRNARSLLGLINDLLNITKIESGKVTLTLGPVNLPRLIEDCLQTVSPLVQHERVELESRIEPSIQNIYSDWGKLKQVILNLLSNAAKFTEDGAIRVEARPLDDDWVELAVSDTGIGIHSEDLPFIFDKFRQVDSSSSRKYGGTGLGLSITSELVKLFGGRITAKSEPGAGSTFIVQLPMSSAAVLTGVGSQAEIVARKTQTMLPVVQERRPSTLGQAVKLKTAPELAPVSVTAPAELDHSSRNVIIVLDEQLESVVRLREGLRVDGYDVKSAFVIADAIALLRSGSPSALVWGEPLPEDDPECQRSQLGELLLSTKTPLIALGDAQLDARVEAVARLPRPATAQAVLELLRALPTES